VESLEKERDKGDWIDHLQIKESVSGYETV